jgi:hypothetical protein
MQLDGTMKQELRIYAVASVVLGLLWLSETTVHEVWPQVSPLLMVGVIGLCLFIIRPLRALPKGRARPPHLLSAAALILPAVAVVMFVRLIAPTVGEAVANLDLHDREIGSLTIALPHGNEKSETGEASNVRIDQAGGLDLSVAVIWRTGEYGESGAQVLADGIAGKLNAPRPIALPDSALSVGVGLPAHSFRVEASGIPMLITVFQCGALAYAVLVSGPGAPGVAPRILSSVRCHADSTLPTPDSATGDSHPGNATDDSHPGSAH